MSLLMKNKNKQFMRVTNFNQIYRMKSWLKLYKTKKKL